MMNNHDFISLIASDGFELEAYIAFPESDQPFPAIILLHEAFGVNTHIRSIADIDAEDMSDGELLSKARNMVIHDL